MTITFNSKSISNNFSGPFTDCDFVGGYNGDGTDKTNYHTELFDSKKMIMNNEKLINDLRELLCSKFHCDIAEMSKAAGVSAEEMYNLLMGVSEPSIKVIENLKKYVLIENVEKFYAGDNVEGDKINEIIIKEGDMNKYSGSATDEKMKILKVENADLKVMLQEKDEIIESLKETIEILKKK